jgi:hypothetical protein
MQLLFANHALPLLLLIIFRNAVASPTVTPFAFLQMSGWQQQG